MQYDLRAMLFKFHEERPCFTTKIEIVIRDDIEYKKLVEQVLYQEGIDTLLNNPLVKESLQNMI